MIIQSTRPTTKRRIGQLSSETDSDQNQASVDEFRATSKWKKAAFASGGLALGALGGLAGGALSILTKSLPIGLGGLLFLSAVRPSAKNKASVSRRLLAAATGLGLVAGLSIGHHSGLAVSAVSGALGLGLLGLQFS